MNTRHDNPNQELDAHRDPITGAPGAHPVGTGIGAAAGGIAAGAAVGAIAGPVGAVIGAAIGAVAGGLAGKEAAEALDPTKEDAYWRENFESRTYVSSGSTYDDYGPAYRYGVDAYARSNGLSFDDAEADLGRGWGDARGSSSLDWERARDASRDSWQRAGDTIRR